MIEFLQTYLLPIALSNAVIAAVVAVIVFAATRASRWPAWTHALWVLVLLKLLAPPLLWLPALGIFESMSSDPGSMVATAGEDAPLESMEAEQIGDPFEGEASGLGEVALQAQTPVPWGKMMLGAWGLGCLGFACLRSFQVLRFRRWLRQAEPAPSDLAARVQAITRQMGLKRPPRAMLVEGLLAPSVFASWGQAVILLPAQLISQFTDGELDTVIAHELSHLRRRDHWVRLLELATGVLFWWHPVVCVARKQIHDSADEACDVMVMSHFPSAMRDYASAMLKTVDFLAADNKLSGDSVNTKSNPAANPLLTGMGDIGSLGKRMRRISRPSSAQAGRGLLQQRIAIGLCALLLLPLGLVLTSPSVVAEQPPAKDPFGGGPVGGNNPFAAPRQPAGKVADGKQNGKESVRGKSKSDAMWRKRLEKKVTLEVKDMPLARFASQISRQTKIPIELDAASLEEIGVGTDVPITASLKDVRLGDALGLVLREVELVYIRKQSKLVITTAEAAEALAKGAAGPKAAGPKPAGRAVGVTPQQIVEDRLRNQMNKKVSVQFTETKLADVIKSLSKQAEIPLIVDRVSLEDVGLTGDAPITINLKDVSLRAALRLILKDLALTYMIKDDVVQITTLESAEQNLTLRAYALPEELGRRADQVVKALTGTVASDTWEVVGGPSSVYAIDNVLAVSTTEEVHHKVSEFIRKVDAAFQSRKKAAKK